MSETTNGRQGWRIDRVMDAIASDIVFALVVGGLLCVAWIGPPAPDLPCARAFRHARTLADTAAALRLPACP